MKRPILITIIVMLLLTSLKAQVKSLSDHRSTHLIVIPAASFITERIVWSAIINDSYLLKITGKGFVYANKITVN